ncbi:MAG TPA: MaoC family dehydratase [Burkholderiaceae bacterium]|nr:MaoC family dehydratase [Burkholderiaceae bacterium]
MKPACLPSLELRCGPISAVDLALYAAASGDHNPLHLDADVARAAGFERPVVHGMLTMACVGRLFTSHFGPLSLLSLQTRFTGAAQRGDTLVLTATLAQQGSETALYNVRGRTQDDVEIVTGSAQVSLGLASSV